MNQEKYTIEEIRKMAPGYRGKPENFDPTKVTPPTNTKAPRNPTAQKALWAESIFGIEVSVRELQVNQEFTPIFAWLPSIVEEMFSALGADDINLNKRLLDIELKRGNTNLSVVGN